MINAVPSASSANNSSGLSTPPRPISDSTPSSASKPPSMRKPRSRSISPKMILAGILLLIVVIGSGAGLYLSQQQQDLRQDASTGDELVVNRDGTTPEEIAENLTGSCGGGGCQYSCSEGHPSQPIIECPGGGDCGSPRAPDICRGKTDGSCQLCQLDPEVRDQFPERAGQNFYACPGEDIDGNAANCDFSCLCGNSDPNVCYEKGPGHDAHTFDGSYECRNTQIDVVKYNDDGTWETPWNCVSDSGKNWSECAPPPEEPGGSYTAFCHPPKPQQNVGDLTYRLVIEDSKPKNVGAVVWYLGFNGNQANIKELTDDFLGKPTWSETCVGQAWCGYWLRQVNDPDPQHEGDIIWDWTSTQKIGPNQKDINQIATKVQQMKDAGKLPADYKIAVHVELRLPGGEVYKFDGNNTQMLDISPYACSHPPVPTANFSAFCTPGQEYSADGSALSYTMRVSNVNPPSVFDRTVAFLSLDKNDLNDAQDQDFESQFGRPNWATKNGAPYQNGGAPSCVGADWCGYWLTATYTYQPVMNFFWDNTKKIGGTGGTKTIKDLVAWGAQNNKTQFTIGANVMVNGIQNDTIGLIFAAIKPDACAAPPPVEKIACGNPGCNTNNDCVDGSICISAQNGQKYCSKPEHQERCAANPSVANCCQGPDCDSFCTTNQQCQGALGPDFSCVNNRCRLTANPSSPTCTPEEPKACNWICSNDLQCQLSNPDHICVPSGSDGQKRCRHKDYPSEPTCKPPAPVCLGISMNPSNPKLNDSVTFTCQEVSVPANYGFRVITPAGKEVPVVAEGNVSKPYHIGTPGQFRAECRICPIVNGQPQCQPWPGGPLPTPTPSPMPSPPVTPPPSPTSTPVPIPTVPPTCTNNSQCSNLICLPENPPICNLATNTCVCGPGSTNL